MEVCRREYAIVDIEQRFTFFFEAFGAVGRNSNVAGSRGIGVG
jgi:hypothetical protein